MIEWNTTKRGESIRHRDGKGLSGSECLLCMQECGHMSDCPHHWEGDKQENLWGMANYQVWWEILYREEAEGDW